MAVAMSYPGSVDNRLADLRFRRRRDGTYRRGAFEVHLGRRWLTMRTRPRSASGRAIDRQHGLWKLTEQRDSDKLIAEFHLPLDLVAASHAWDTEQGVAVDPLEQALGWAIDSARSQVRTGWQPPTDAALAKLLAPDSLTVHVGDHVRQGLVDPSAGRLVVRFPLLQRVPPELTRSRQAWLQLMLSHVHHRCRMARIGPNDRGEILTSAEVEVDLTGAPSCLLPELLRVAAVTAGSVVSWFLLPLTILADTNVSCSAWEIDPQRTWSAQRKEVES